METDEDVEGELEKDVVEEERREEVSVVDSNNLLTPLPGCQ